MCLAKRAIRLFSPFTSSDIIIASPLGLALLVQDNADKKQNFDFLSSIEVVVMDQTDALLMQNWEHVRTSLDATNKIPRKALDTDFSRIRGWCLDGHAKHLRQTVILSAFATAEINALFSRHCHTAFARYRSIERPEGVLQHVALSARQVFQRLPTESLQDMDQARFTFFVTRIVPRLIQTGQSHTLIFVRSYFDFVRIRNYFRKEEVSCAMCCEYSKGTDLTRSRSRFFHGERLLMLFTERLHHFKRPKLRGIQSIFFYQLPWRAEFYTELVNMMSDRGGGLQVTTLFHRVDRLELQRVVGVDRADTLLTSTKQAHLFC